MTKKLSILTKFNNFINRQNIDDVEKLYFVLSALRGPDDNLKYSTDLKLYTTARIRSFLPKKLTAGCNVLNNPLPDSGISLRDELIEQYRSRNHFIYYYEAAVKAIRKLENYDLSTERKI